MSQNVPETDPELLQRLLAKLEESSARADNGDNDDIKRKLDKLDSVVGSRSQYVQQALMLIAGALIPTVFNLLVK